MSTANLDRQNRSFGFVMAGGFAVLAVLRYFVAGTVSGWLFGLGICFGGAALLHPAVLEPVRRLWMKLAGVLGAVNQRIILTVLFAFLVTPMALLLRLLGKQPITLRLDPTVGSYWRRRGGEEFTAARMERQF
jgi:hypothetical protein